jgi:two-component system phosphate regulon sensor histidine kinase PhoR
MPVVLLSAADIVALAVGSDVQTLVVGVLVVTLAIASLGAAVVILVVLQRRWQLARRQVTFLSTVTHELRTPLAAIRLYAQTLEMDRAQDEEDRRRCAMAILRETRRLEHLVERMLHWRRILQGRAVVALSAERTDAALEEAVESFRGLVEAGEATMEVDLAARQPVRMDRAAITEAVLNLLVNAHKYTGDEKRIRLASRDEGNEVAIDVSDNGIGIARGDIRRISEPYFRADNRLRAPASGVGLGLAIVRDTMQAHGGRLEIRSELGRGSTFTLRLPAADSETTEPPEASGQEG